MTSKIPEDQMKNFKALMLTAIELLEESKEKSYLELVEKRVNASLKRLEDGSEST